MPNSTSLLRVSGFPAAAAAMLLAILAQATGAFYTALLVVERAHMTPLELSVFLTLSAISSIGVTALFGSWFDRAPSRLPLLIALVAALIGYPLCVLLTDKLALIAVGFLLLGTFNAAQPLLFALAKAHLDHADSATSSRGMAAMRMISSLGWGIGPAVGAVLVTIWSYEGAFFGGGLFALAALLFSVFIPMARPVHDDAGPTKLPPGLWRSLLPVAIAFVFFHSSMFIGSTALSLSVVSPLGGHPADIGWIQTACAAVEVVVMGLFVLRPMHHADVRLVALGFALFAAYFIAPLIWPMLGTMWAGQLLRGTAIGIVNVLGMLYVQDQMPGRAGAASGLFANTINTGMLLSGIGTGLWASQFGYWSLFWLCTGLAIAGGLLFAASARRAPAPAVTPAAAPR